MPSKSRRSLETRLTAKVGPLPVWAWAALILGAALLYLHLNPSSAAAADATPVSADTGSAAQQPAGGGGNAAGNLNDGLLDAAGVDTTDPLTFQVQQTDASSGQSPQALAPAVGSPAYFAGDPAAQTASGSSTGGYSDPYAGALTAHDSVVYAPTGPQASAVPGIHTPGLQA